MLKVQERSTSAGLVVLTLGLLHQISNFLWIVVRNLLHLKHIAGPTFLALQISEKVPRNAGCVRLFEQDMASEIGPFLNLAQPDVLQP